VVARRPSIAEEENKSEVSNVQPGNIVNKHKSNKNDVDDVIVQPPPKQKKRLVSE